MENDPVWNKIARKLAGESRSDEELAVKEWANRDKLNQGILSRLIEIWEYNPAGSSKSPRIYRTYKNRLNYHEKKHNENSFIFYTLRLAAILFLIVGTAALVNTFFPFYEKQEISWQEISVPRGSRTFILLPDSSKVWLSNNSTLKYPDKFDKTARELYLKGEAYFEVTHDTKTPFVVNMGLDRIKVLGTRFSVTAYPEENTVRADLLDGKIQMDINERKGGDSYRSFIVKPSHSLVYEKTSGKLFSSVIPDGFFDYWKNGIYNFNNESLESLAQKIDRIYNVEIVFENDYLKTKRFSGNLSTDDNIFTFMEAIKRTSLDPIEYSYKNKKIYIKLKSN
jgi:ferric-dicitrate binding protein FerR (iron transport regulator)